MPRAIDQCPSENPMIPGTRCAKPFGHSGPHTDALGWLKWERPSAPKPEDRNGE